MSLESAGSVSIFRLGNLRFLPFEVGNAVYDVKPDRSVLCRHCLSHSAQQSGANAI